MYQVFVRNWWRPDPKKRGGLLPNPGARKTTIARVPTEGEAQQICREYNRENDPGRLSRKAEYRKE